MIRKSIVNDCKTHFMKYITMINYVLQHKKKIITLESMYKSMMYGNIITDKNKLLFESSGRKRFMYVRSVNLKSTIFHGL